MGRKLEPILTEEMQLIPTDTEYPCATCSKLKSDGNCSNNTPCIKWQSWFGEAWRLVTDRIKQEGKP